MNKYRGHDDYLNIEKLIEQYTPLMNSIYRKFSSYNGVFNNASDYEDLMSQIHTEFVRLCQEYDPTRGVDFAGYIKFHLQQRVYHWVTKVQRVQNKETLSTSATWKGTDDESAYDFENQKDLIDYDTEHQVFKAEALASLDWRLLENPKHKRLVEMILFENKSLEEIATAEGVGLNTIKQRFNEVCNLFIDHYNFMSKYYDEESND